MYYVVKYGGPFGFIKPWTAVRDGETYSQQFLTPSNIEGIEKKLFPEMLSKKGVIEKITRYRLSYSSIDVQQEQTQTRGWEYKAKNKMMIRNRSILKRGILLNPILYLAFMKIEDAESAAKQHICLCRNEDILFPDEKILKLSAQEFKEINGFELRFGLSGESFLVGYNRFDNSAMYGWLEIDGQSVLNYDE